MRCSTVFFFQAEDGIRDKLVTGVQTCALPIWARSFQQGDSYMLELLEAVGREHGFSMDVPLNTFSEAQMKVLMYGADKRSEERRVGKECRSRRSWLNRRKIVRKTAIQLRNHGF